MFQLKSLIGEKFNSSYPPLEGGAKSKISGRGEITILANTLEELAEKYETVDFIKDDPIQFAHRFLIRHCEIKDAETDKECPPKQSPSHLQNTEIAAFLASLFAYGNRKVFIKKLNELFEIMNNKPLEYVLNFDPKTLKGFNYRFAKDFDIIEVFHILNKLYKEDGGLRALFKYSYAISSAPPEGEVEFQCKERALEIREGGNIKQMLQAVTDYFYSNTKNEVGQGFYHLIPNPKNGGAMKRMNMFLRWVVRKGPVDLGLWDFIPTSELLIPIDVHVSRISREMGLLTRNSNDFKAVIELTENLKKICPTDPVKFDFAMFGVGVNGVE